MKKKKLIIPITVLIIIILGIYLIFFRKEKTEFSIVKAVKGNVVQEISETGVVKKGEEINLGFKSSGQIDKISVKVGDIVKTGQELARLDSSQLAIQLSEARAALEVVQAQKSDAQISLEEAERNLSTIEAKADDDLNSAYEDALTVLDDAYLKIYNTSNVVNNVQKTYFSTPNEYGLNVMEEKARIQLALDKVKDLVANAKSDPKHENIDSALPQTKEMLEKTGAAIKGIRDITENGVYRELVSSTDKASLDTQKLNINTAFTNVVNALQSISTIKITNTENINNAKAKVDTLKSQLQSGAGSAGLYQAQINQARAQVSLLEKNIQDSVLKSPTDGKVIKVEKRIGETAQMTDAVITLLPLAPFQIEVDIYEEDIIRVKIENQVNITLAAFPEQIFSGRVIAIDPAEKLVEGVVYYKVTIDFQDPPEEIKPGMTVDVIIETDSRENVLTLPNEAIEKKDGKMIVNVLKGKDLQEREIKIGLEGSDGMTEVLSGLKEGEEVAIK